MLGALNTNQVPGASLPAWLRALPLTSTSPLSAKPAGVGGAGENSCRGGGPWERQVVCRPGPCAPGLVLAAAGLWGRGPDLGAGGQTAFLWGSRQSCT